MRADSEILAPQGRDAASGVKPLRANVADNVDVVLETYLGSASMTVGELNALAQDALVALDCSLNASVELRLNGVTIAHGELVAVGDRFGVRITTLAP